LNSEGREEKAIYISLPAGFLKVGEMVRVLAEVCRRGRASEGEGEWTSSMGIS